MYEKQLAPCLNQLAPKRRHPLCVQDTTLYIFTCHAHFLLVWQCRDHLIRGLQVKLM